jgi:hypothetical protein
MTALVAAGLDGAADQEIRDAVLPRSLASAAWLTSSEKTLRARDAAGHAASHFADAFRDPAF